MAASNRYTNFPNGTTSMGIPQIGQGVPATPGIHTAAHVERALPTESRP